MTIDRDQEQQRRLKYLRQTLERNIAKEKDKQKPLPNEPLSFLNKVIQFFDVLGIVETLDKAALLENADKQKIEIVHQIKNLYLKHRLQYKEEEDQLNKDIATDRFQIKQEVSKMALAYGGEISLNSLEDQVLLNKLMKQVDPAKIRNKHVIGYIEHDGGILFYDSGLGNVFNFSQPPNKGQLKKEFDLFLKEYLKLYPLANVIQVNIGSSAAPSISAHKGSPLFIPYTLGAKKDESVKSSLASREQSPNAPKDHEPPSSGKKLK